MWPYLLLGAALLAVGVSAWQPIPAGVWHDDGVYMLVSKSLAEGGGLRYTGVPGHPPAVKFPPLYPGVLAVLWLVLGSIGPVTLVAELLNLALLALAGTLFAWALARAGVVSRTRAIVVAALAFVSADLWRIALIPLSEALFVALAACALVAWGPALDERRRWGWVPLSLSLVALVLTRSAGVAFVVGFAVALLVHRRVRRATLVVAPAVLTMVVWGAWAAHEASLIPPSLRDLLGPYGGWLAAETIGAPAAFVAGLPHQISGVLGEVASFLVPGLIGPIVWLAALPLAVAALWGAVRLGRSFAPIPWIVGAYLGMLVVWPYLDRRLAVPVHPLVVVLLAVGGLDLIRRWRRPWARALVVAVALTWVVGYAGMSAERVTTGWAAAPYRLRARRLATAVEALDRTTPPNAVVGAPEFWAALHLHGGWQVVPSARFAPLAEGGEAPVWGTPMQQLQTWWATGVDHVLLEQGGEIHGAALDLLEARCPGSVHILARMPPQLLVRLDWDARCAAAVGLKRREP
jgi:hypothetical protein